MNTFLKRERNISLIVDRYFIIDYPKSLEQQIIIKLGTFTENLFFFKFIVKNYSNKQMMAH